MNRHDRRKADAQARRKPRIESEHNYFRPYLEATTKGLEDGTIERGRVTIINVHHDEWCGIYRSELCNCDPEIDLQPLARPEEIN